MSDLLNNQQIKEQEVRMYGLPDQLQNRVDEQQKEIDRLKFGLMRVLNFLELADPLYAQKVAREILEIPE